MKRCICFSVSPNNDEKNYIYMCYLLISSIKITNPQIDIYCALLTDLSLKIDKKLINYINKNCTLIKDKRFNVNGNDNYFLRNYTCWYFSHIYDLTEKYDNVIYTDIDVVFLNNFDFILNENEILVEEMPEIVKEEELTYKSNLIYFNWIDIITKSNKFIYEMDYSKNEIQEKTEFFYTQNVLNSKLKLIKNTFGAIYPVKPLNNKNLCFHYDNFDQRGYYYKLKKHKLFNKLDFISKKFFSRKYLENYWENKKHGLKNYWKTL